MQFSAHNAALLSYNLDQCYVCPEGVWVRGGIAPLILILNTMYRSAARFISCPLRLLKKSPPVGL